MVETTANQNESRSVFPSQEEQVLNYWQENKIFQKTLDRNKNKKPFVFFEGPPTANGKPGLHHVEARAFKDLVCRFKTMEGYLVNRKGGWDTHGLPVELEVEKQLGFTNKGDIEKYGVANFNAKAKESVWKYLNDWQRLTDRMGYFVDMQNPYITYSQPYMESVWWILKNIYDKGLMYHGYKIGPYCPRCGTTLSSHELAQGYQTVHDPSIFVKFYLKDFPKNKNSKKTALLVWTTTPWTLPANLAVAVGENLEYNQWLVGEEILISLHELPSREGETNKPKLLGKIMGKELVGLSYEPLYALGNVDITKVYKVFAGSFISETDGTGLVHIAPSYGEDDFKLGQKYNLPVIINLDGEGKFNSAPKSLPIILGKFFKDADPIILKDLKEKDLVYIGNLGGTIHEYPFCWRCHTPLIYRTNESWFINMPNKKKELLANNQKINWVPASYKTGRFGGWLREVRDWNLSRRRYWGTPLPIWQCTSCHHEMAVGSLDEISKLNIEQANIYLLRHGEATNNTQHYFSTYPEIGRIAHLTPKGKREVVTAAEKIHKQKEKIDIIISSDLERTKETANIISGILNVPVIFNENFREINVGNLNGTSITEKQARDFKKNHKERDFTSSGGEDYSTVQKRMIQGLKEVINQYPQKNVLIVSHETSLIALLNSRKQNLLEFKNADLKKLAWAHLPINTQGESDLHRPYVDEIKLKCPKCGESMTRVLDLIDVWFDSGSMPFAQWHYPFENKNLIDKKIAYPADYICEAADQTRGWFYTLLAISTLLDKGPSYKNVISVGLVLDEKGEKMSKTKGNIVDPWSLFNSYGADALRWYFFRVNAPEESKLFSEKEMLQYFRRFIMPLWNVYLFYEMYQSKSVVTLPKKAPETSHLRILDQWILVRTSEVADQVKLLLDQYKINEASKELENFVDDLSRWYLRRSRKVFQKPNSSNELKISTTVLSYVLGETAKIISPFCPFLAETLWQKLGGKSLAKSVHLCDWPKSKKITSSDKKLLEQMDVIRNLASVGLQIRQTSGIKVRQPLSTLEISVSTFKNIKQIDFWEILKDELNIKEIKKVNQFSKKDNWKIGELGKLKANLDTNITKELYEEGLMNDLIRGLQDLRQKTGLKPDKFINLCLNTANEDIENILRTNEKIIKEAVKAKTLSFEKDPKANAPLEIEMGETIVSASLKEI